jgi:RNA-binding protein PNO1
MMETDAHYSPEELQQRQQQGAECEDEMIDEGELPNFPALSAEKMRGGKTEFRRVRCPPHRVTPLRNNWEKIISPLVEHMKLQVR